MTYRNSFTRPARELRSKGQQLRQLHQIGKAGGLAVAGLSGLGLVASAATVLPLAIGALTYAAALLSEQARTGKLKLLPWLEDDLGQIAARSLHATPALSLNSQAHHYLEPEDKALFYLTNFKGPELTALSETYDFEEFQHIVTNLVDHLVTAHLPALNHPELIGAGLGVDFLQQAIASIPKPASKPIPPFKPTSPPPKVPAAPRSEALPPAPSGAPSTAVEQPKQAIPQRQTKTALDSLLTAPFSSRAFFGGQRTGKSFLAAVATQRLAVTQGVKTYHLNLSSFGDEDADYWKHARRSLCADLGRLEDHHAASIIQDAIALVSDFIEDSNAILIVDEWAILTSLNNRHVLTLQPLMALIADQISTLASTGMKRQRSIWTIAPEFVATGLTQEGKSAKKLQLMLIAIPPGKTVDWSGQSITFDHSLFNQLKNNFIVDMPTLSASLAGCDRIAFTDSGWLPIGVGKDDLTVDVPAIVLENEAQQPDFDSPVANALMQTLKIQHYAEGLKKQYQEDAAFCAFIDWLVTLYGGQEIIGYERFKNTSSFKKTGRSQVEFARLVNLALENQLLLQTIDGYVVAAWG